jgi:hypothetical protein
LSSDLVLAEDLVAADGEVVAVDAAGSPRELGPVYRRVPGGEPVLPTGRILVRFDDRADRTAVLAAAGYRLTETIGYAPEAVWARALDGGVIGSLSGLDRLTGAAGVVAAEPELISERTWKG